MPFHAPTTSLLTAAVELSRGEIRPGISRARIAFRHLADSDDEHELTEAIGLILLGVNARENQRHNTKGRVA